MERDSKVYIEDILESLELIAEYVDGVIEEEFRSDQQLQDAVIRRFEIVGEAAKQVPESFRNKYPYVPWRTLAGLRDVLIHQYFGVSIDRIWKMVENELNKTINDVFRVVRDLTKKKQPDE
jgi:uncharacterized protein with HEPN domain